MLTDTNSSRGDRMADGGSEDGGEIAPNIARRWATYNIHEL